jgi:phosphatidylglycerol---prolipoprotein diacylglyceryl transferase
MNYGYLHTLDPFAIRIWEDFGIRWYGLSYLVGFLLGYLIIRWMIARGGSNMPAAKAGDFVFSVALGCVIGGRLGYCLFYSPDLLIDFEPSFPFWGVLSLHKGGMASHGGMIGIAVSCILFARKHKLLTLHLFDLTILGATIGIFFGRIANFINAELVGRPAADNFRFGVRYPQEILDWPFDAPHKLSSLSDLTPKVGIDSSSWTIWLQQLQTSSGWQNVSQTLNQIVAKIQSGDTALAEALRPLLTNRHPSQLYAALLEGLLLFIILAWVWRKPRKPGVITALFFSLYAVVRIIGEQFRMPDPHLGFQLFELTRGQWLSIGLLVIGLTALYTWHRNPTAKVMGGWAKSSSPPK